MPTQFPVPPNPSRSDDRNFDRSAEKSIEVFRACHQRYNECLEYRNLRTKSIVSETVASYLLDFDLASKRAIGTDNNRYRLFQLHFLQGYSAAEICREFGMARFTVASELAQIEKLAGSAFIQRGMFPLSSYFGEQRTDVVSERRAA